MVAGGGDVRREELVEPIEAAGRDGDRLAAGEGRQDVQVGLELLLRPQQQVRVRGVEPQPVGGDRVEQPDVLFAELGAAEHILELVEPADGGGRVGGPLRRLGRRAQLGSDAVEQVERQPQPGEDDVDGVRPAGEPCASKVQADDRGGGLEVQHRRAGVACEGPVPGGRVHLDLVDEGRRAAAVRADDHGVVDRGHDAGGVAGGAARLLDLVPRQRRPRKRGRHPNVANREQRQAAAADDLARVDDVVHAADRRRMAGDRADDRLQRTIWRRWRRSVRRGHVVGAGADRRRPFAAAHVVGAVRVCHVDEVAGLRVAGLEAERAGPTVREQYPRLPRVAHGHRQGLLVVVAWSGAIAAAVLGMRSLLTAHDQWHAFHRLWQGRQRRLGVDQDLEDELPRRAVKTDTHAEHAGSRQQVSLVACLNRLQPGDLLPRGGARIPGEIRLRPGGRSPRECYRDKHGCYYPLYTGHDGRAADRRHGCVYQAG